MVSRRAMAASSSLGRGAAAGSRAAPASARDCIRGMRRHLPVRGRESVGLPCGGEEDRSRERGRRDPGPGMRPTVLRRENTFLGASRGAGASRRPLPPAGCFASISARHRLRWIGLHRRLPSPARCRGSSGPPSRPRARPRCRRPIRRRYPESSLLPATARRKMQRARRRRTCP